TADRCVRRRADSIGVVGVADGEVVAVEVAWRTCKAVDSAPGNYHGCRSLIASAAVVARCLSWEKGCGERAVLVCNYNLIGISTETIQRHTRLHHRDKSSVG